MRSFLGRDILSLKDMEREEYFQIFSVADRLKPFAAEDRKSTRLNSSHLGTSYAVFCLKKRAFNFTKTPSSAESAISPQISRTKHYFKRLRHLEILFFLDSGGPGVTKALPARDPVHY